MAIFNLNINGKEQQFDVDPDTPLLWAMREEAGLIGTKFGCGIAQCGASTVHVDGVAVRSCSYPAEAAQGAEITTIEGVGSTESLNPVQQAWLEIDMSHCGDCQSGQIMAATAFLTDTPDPTDAETDAAMSNICRRRTYPRIKAAIRRAVELSEGGDDDTWFQSHPPRLSDTGSWGHRQSLAIAYPQRPVCTA